MNNFMYDVAAHEWHTCLNIPPIFIVLLSLLLDIYAVHSFLPVFMFSISPPLYHTLLLKTNPTPPSHNNTILRSHLIFE
jgi:hypothetical protein